MSDPLEIISGLLEDELSPVGPDENGDDHGQWVSDLAPDLLAERIVAALSRVMLREETRTEWASHGGALVWGSGEQAELRARAEVAEGKGPLMSRTVYVGQFAPVPGSDA